MRLAAGDIVAISGPREVMVELIGTRAATAPWERVDREAGAIDGALAQSYAHLRSTGRLVVYGFHTMLSRGSDIVFGAGGSDVKLTSHMARVGLNYKF